MEDLPPNSESRVSEKTPHRHDAPHRGVNFAHEFNRAGQFFRPNGKKIHVASSPGEVEPLRRKLSTVEREDAFDIVIHGSAEHVNALRETHEHQTVLRDQLRLKYGNDFEEFERIVKELDQLSSELHMISHHAVNLDANFSKYGYSAHLRTIPNSGESSKASSIHAGHEHEDHDWDAERKQGQFMVFYRKPVMRQYFHKGLLWRASESAEVKSYELFIDLLYVGILAIAGDGAAEEANGLGLLRFAITFILAWKLWSDVSQALAWIIMDDITRRLSILFMMVILLGLATNMSGSFNNTYIPLIAFYVAGRWYCALYFFWMGYLIPMVRNAMIGSGIFCFFPGFIWIGSIYVNNPAKQALIWPAIAFDIFGPIILVTFEHGLGPWGSRLKEYIKTAFEFTPGQNIEHKIERTNAFVALVFGYSIVAILYQSSVPFGINAFFGKAILGLIQSFTFNWLYFEIDTFNMYQHAIRRHFISAFIWLCTHLPFVMSFTLAGASLARIVITHDTAESQPEDLLEPYASEAQAELPDALWWFYCAGLGIALASTGFIALCHNMKTIPNVRLTRPYRLAVRFAVSVVLILLPLARHHLSSLELVATTTSLVVLVLLVELAGSTCAGDAFWGFSQKNYCTYSAHTKMSKSEFENKLRTGDVVNVEELAQKGRRKGEINRDMIV